MMSRFALRSNVKSYMLSPIVKSYIDVKRQELHVEIHVNVILNANFNLSR